MTSKRNKGNNKPFTIFLIILSILDLLFLYYLKYKNHGLTLMEFNFGIGNFLNLFFTVLLVAGLILTIKRDTRINGAAVYIFLMTLFLIAPVFVNLIEIPLPEYYIFNHPFPDILVASLFCAFQIFQFISISIVWSKVRDRGNLLHLKASGNSLLLVIILLAFAYVFTMKEVGIQVQKNDMQNVGVVLGAAVWSHDKPSPTLSSRLDKAVELYKNGFLQKVQLTGSNAPGELSEAEVAFKYVMNRGVVPEDIYYEDKTTSTSEQVKFIKERLTVGRIPANIIIISDNYHLPRIKEITKFYNVNADLAGSKLVLSEKDLLYYNLRESLGLVIFWLFAL